ncbi:MAG: aldo/keto reductase [Sedimentitalea sp.]|uniref:aldo/keto reductase n=1 Tax=Sedimentitalea sp. TaxID=2048915 RepID=UPI003296EE9E
MKTNLLGRTGIHVSELCYGTMSFGGDADEAMSAKLYAACRDAGVNFFDCANVYSDGRAEEILGDLMAHERDDLVVTSKVFGSMGPGPNDVGLSRRNIAQSIEASLKRMKTDRLDVYFIHKIDPATPMDETLRGLEDVVRSGKVLHIGASNHAAWQIALALGISAREGWSRFDVLQPMYSLVKRQAETEILPLAQDQNLAVIPYSPAGGGLLSGKFRPGVKPEGARLATDARYAERYGESWVYEVAEKFTAFADKMGVHPMSLAVAWTAGHPAVTAPIIGARNTDQLVASLKSVEIDMNEDLRAEIAALSRKPAPANDRLEEQD